MTKPTDLKAKAREIAHDVWPMMSVDHVAEVFAAALAEAQEETWREAEAMARARQQEGGVAQSLAAQFRSKAAAVRTGKG